MTQERVRGSTNTDKRISVHERTRDQIRYLQEDGQTYSELIRELIPKEPDGDQLREDDEQVTISTDSEAYQRIADHAGDGVPLRHVIEYFVLRELIGGDLSLHDVLEQVYGVEDHIQDEIDTDNDGNDR